jgi:four helix bundle protein
MENQEAKTDKAGSEYSYRNLVLWQKAQALALKVIREVASLPRDRTADIIARQVIRSSSSIAANIAEGHGRYSLAAHKNHLSIAKGSACETDNWVDLLRRAGYLKEAADRELHASRQELIRMLTAKIRELERLETKPRQSPRLREESVPYWPSDDDEDEVPGSQF